MQELLIIIALALANGIFAATELATISARRGRLQQAADEGSSGAAAAIRLQEDPNRFLSAVQIGITLIGTLNGVFAGATLASRLTPFFAGIEPIAPYADNLAQFVVVLLVTYLSLVLGELVPKRLALQSAEQFASLMARPMTMIAAISRPVVALLTFSTNTILRLIGRGNVGEERVTEDDIRQLIREGAEEGAVEPHEQVIIERLFRATDRSVRSIMTPRHDVQMLDGDLAINEVMADLIESGFSRFPVYEENNDRIIGITHVRDLLSLYHSQGGSALVRETATQPLYVPENSPAIELLATFKRTRRHMAIVVDELGGIAGVVTLEDVLEEIVGEIDDEYDEAEQPAIVYREDGSLLVDGVIPIDQAKQLLGVSELPEEETFRFDTLAGFVISLFGYIPRAGEIAEWDGRRFEVMDMDGLRVDKVLISSSPALSAAENEA